MVFEGAGEMRGTRKACGESKFRQGERALFQQAPGVIEPDPTVGTMKTNSKMLREQPIEMSRAHRRETGHCATIKRLLDRRLHLLEDRDQSRVMRPIAFAAFINMG